MAGKPTVINPPVARRYARRQGIDWRELRGPEREQCYFEYLNERVDKQSGRRANRVKIYKFCRAICAPMHKTMQWLAGKL